MTANFFWWSVPCLAGFVMCNTIGCSRWIDVKPPSAGPQEHIFRSLPGNERVPLVMDSFQLSRNGAPQEPSIEAERRILNSIQETSLFSTLVPRGGKSDSLDEKIVSVRITVDETIEPHSGLSALKGIAIGGSMFLFSPFIELTYDYAAKVGLEFERWDGNIRRYDARSFGTVHYKLFGATPVMIDELKGHVTEACLVDLMKQLVRDTDLYMASSASSPALSIRTVIIKSRTPTIAASVLSIVRTAGGSTE
ncbi:MAG: hypothetical protein H8K07_08635 [Nitrospira sp.]|nr:hypothetical protein [Nitrospira sp.]MDI3462583.1 hypothetical protein [Nitrospira sp.]